jgi:hypothetical protein
LIKMAFWNKKKKEETGGLTKDDLDLIELQKKKEILRRHIAETDAALLQHGEPVQQNGPPQQREAFKIIREQQMNARNRDEERAEIVMQRQRPPQQQQQQRQQPQQGYMQQPAQQYAPAAVSAEQLQTDTMTGTVLITIYESKYEDLAQIQRNVLLNEIGKYLPGYVEDLRMRRQAQMAQVQAAARGPQQQQQEPAHEDAGETEGESVDIPL